MNLLNRDKSIDACPLICSDNDRGYDRRAMIIGFPVAGRLKCLMYQNENQVWTEIGFEIQKKSLGQTLTDTLCTLYKNNYYNNARATRDRGHL